jgi:hypothetical protein
LGSATALNGSWVVGLRAMYLLYSHMGICQYLILEYMFDFVKGEIR